MFKQRTVFAALSMGAFLVIAQTQPAEARTNPEPVAVRLVSLATANLGDCCAPQPACCQKPCITYRHRGPKLCCGCCQPPVPTVLSVKNPCTCCEIEVPVCLPACCTGEPKVCRGTGLFGRDVVEYEWCCGFSVRVAFKHCGDLIVTTWGR